VDADQVTYIVLDPDNSPWFAFGSFGSPLTRSAALSEDNRSTLFALAEAANETPLSSRVLSARFTS
jgi:hypothetical protein